jgi:hypothetical protein
MTDFVSFSNALAREGRRLVILAPGAAADPGIAGVIIGPAAVDLGAAGHLEHVIVQREAGAFAAWREADLARFYRQAV